MQQLKHKQNKWKSFWINFLFCEEKWPKKKKSIQQMSWNGKRFSMNKGWHYTLHQGQFVWFTTVMGLWTQASKNKVSCICPRWGTRACGPQGGCLKSLRSQNCEISGCHIRSMCGNQLHLTGFFAWAFLTNQKLGLNLLAAVVSFLKIPRRHSPPYSTGKLLWKLTFADSFIKYILSIYLGVTYCKIVWICCVLKVHICIVFIEVERARER